MTIVMDWHRFDSDTQIIYLNLVTQIMARYHLSYDLLINQTPTRRTTEKEIQKKQKLFMDSLVKTTKKVTNLSE